MARPLAADSISLTGAGVALVTSAMGSIRPDAVEGLVVDDRRVVSRWQVGAEGGTLRHVGWERTGPSSDRLLFTVTTHPAFDPVAVLERARTVSGSGFSEHLRLTAYAGAVRCRLVITAERDEQAVFHLGDVGPPADDSSAMDTDVRSPSPLEATDGSAVLREPGGGDHVVTIEAPGWRSPSDGGTGSRDGDRLVADIDVGPGETWQSIVRVRVATDRADAPVAQVGAVAITTVPDELGHAIFDARQDLRALTMPIDGRDVLAAGSPFFLALFGRDSMIAGMQFLLDSWRPLIDILSELARHQANSTDARTGAEPGRILHELRIGRAGVFGLQPGEAYYGAVDTSPLFVVALGEAANWGAPRREIAALLPAAHAALRWCAEHGDVDSDGFVESVPHPTGLTNLGWKDSADSVIDAAGNVIVDRVALCEVQAYWYRALRTLAGLERWLGTGDGAHHDRDAEALAARFVDKFVYDTDDGPFVGLALDGDKKLLTVRTSNAGHVLWSGLLPPSIADSVATQLVGDDLFSGWGVRTVGARAAGYNPFGYHRGSVWPHDTALAMHGAARIGRVDVVSALGEGLTALDAANGGQLPELLSGIARRDMSLPVPYTAACRPQAWAAGAMLVVARALLGLEPDVPNSTLRLNPCLGDGTAVTVRDLQLGDHAVSFHVEGSRVVDIAAPRMRVIVGADAVLARSPWGRASS